MQDDFEYVFRDFQFVGDVRVGDSKTLQEHGVISLSFPSGIDTHRSYIFHLGSARTTEELSRVLIPRILRSRGFVILSAPQRDDDYVLADIGEPLWVIDFEKGDCRGSIYNTVDMKLYNESGRAAAAQMDYVLEVKSPLAGALPE